MEQPSKLEREKLYVLLHDIYRRYMDAAEEEFKRAVTALLLVIAQQADEHDGE